MTIYFVMTKLHGVDSTLARRAINNRHVTRQGFGEIFKTIFEETMSRSIASKLDHAEATREKILHEKEVREADKRKAVFVILNYAEKFNKHSEDMGGFKPFGSLRGYRGRGQSLNNAASRWVIRGMGFSEFQ